MIVHEAGGRGSSRCPGVRKADAMDSEDGNCSVGFLASASPSASAAVPTTTKRRRHAAAPGADDGAAMDVDFAPPPSASARGYPPSTCPAAATQAAAVGLDGSSSLPDEDEILMQVRRPRTAAIGDGFLIEVR